MASPNPSEEEDDDADAWLVTYADAVTLLMAFFIMLVSFSKVDIPTYDQVAAGIKNQLGKREVISPTTKMKLDLETVVFTMQADQAVNIQTDPKGVVMELSSSSFYKPGSADIREEAVPVLQKMAQMIAAPIYNTYLIEVEGHTDDDPISTSRYPSNWELSAGRASGVVRLFREEGIEGCRLKATGFAETRPKVPNRDADGSPIPENQAANRRVIVRVSPMSLEEREECLQPMVPDDLSMGLGEFGPKQDQAPASGQPAESGSNQGNQGSEVTP
jgi:chemotaxis protein MotB